MRTAINVVCLPIMPIHVLNCVSVTFLNVLKTTDLLPVLKEQLTVLMVNVVRLVIHLLNPHALALAPLHWSAMSTLVGRTTTSVRTLKTSTLLTRQIKALKLVPEPPVLTAFLFGLPILRLPCGESVLLPTMVNWRLLSLSILLCTPFTAPACWHWLHGSCTRNQRRR